MAWLQCTFPNGASLGQGKHALTYEEALRLTEGSSDVHRILLENTPKRNRGGDSKSAAVKNQDSLTNLDRVPFRSGARKVTLAIRLSQEKPKVFEAFRNGKYKTITEAATAGGLLKSNGRLRMAKSAFRNMTNDERAEFPKWMNSEDAQPKPGKKKNNVSKSVHIYIDFRPLVVYIYIDTTRGGMVMNPREERGLIIAATSRLHRNDDGTWRVPSQTSREAIFYTVNLETKACTCPDCSENGFVCKHYFAASIVHKAAT